MHTTKALLNVLTMERDEQLLYIIRNCTFISTYSHSNQSYALFSCDDFFIELNEIPLPNGEYCMKLFPRIPDNHPLLQQISVEHFSSGSLP